MLVRRGFIGLGIAAATGLPARAATYPAKPLRLLVAFPPGGPSDVLARIVGQQLNQELEQSVVVDNRPGAGGNVAAEIAAKQAPDGYTLLMANNSILAANAFLYQHLTFNPLTDFDPVALIGRQPNILVVSPQLGVGSVADLIALAKAKPGQLNFGSSGNGTAAHLAGRVVPAASRHRHRPRRLSGCCPRPDRPYCRPDPDDVRDVRRCYSVHAKRYAQSPCGHDGAPVSRRRLSANHAGSRTAEF